MQASECRSSLVAALAMIMAATGLGGCQSLATVMTQVDLEMTVEPVGENSQTLGQLYSRESTGKWPFDFPGYRDEWLEWWIQVPLTGISMDLTSHAQQPLQLRWDQSRWRSSEHPELIPLRVLRFSTGFLPERRIWIDVATGEPATRPVALEIEAGESLRLSFRADHAPLFGQGDLFGIQRVDKGHGFIDDGIGRWLELELPVEAGDRSWTYRIRLTARDIAQWNSYH